MQISEHELRKIWQDAGGGFHGPHVEHATMPAAQFFPFLRRLFEIESNARELASDLDALIRKWSG